MQKHWRMIRTDPYTCAKRWSVEILLPTCATATATASRVTGDRRGTVATLTHGLERWSLLLYGDPVPFQTVPHEQQSRVEPFRYAAAAKRR